MKIMSRKCLKVIVMALAVDFHHDLIKPEMLNNNSCTNSLLSSFQETS